MAMKGKLRNQEKRNPSSLLAIGAFNGYLHVPNRGTENIKRVLFAPNRSTLELRGVPPTLRDSHSAASGDA
jgi:hypothetical protein